MSTQGYKNRVAKIRAKITKLTQDGCLRFLALTPATVENIKTVAVHQDKAEFVNCELCAFRCFISPEAIIILQAGAVALCSGCFDALGRAGAWKTPRVQSIDPGILAPNLTTQEN